MPRHAAHSTEWTVEMVRALPDDGNRYEVIDGELWVTAALSLAHQRAVRELLLLVHPYVSAHGIGEALIAPPTWLSTDHVSSFSPISSSCRSWTAPRCAPGPRWAGCWSRSRSSHHRRGGRIVAASERCTGRKASPTTGSSNTDERTVEWTRLDDSPVETLVETLVWQPDRDVPPLAIDLRAYFRPGPWHSVADHEAEGRDRVLGHHRVLRSRPAS
jgi:hypothetical protein